MFFFFHSMELSCVLFKDSTDAFREICLDSGRSAGTLRDVFEKSSRAEFAHTHARHGFPCSASRATLRITGVYSGTQTPILI